MHGHWRYDGLRRPSPCGPRVRYDPECRGLCSGSRPPSTPNGRGCQYEGSSRFDAAFRNDRNKPPTLCYSMLCYAMLCFAVLCSATLFVLCYASMRVKGLGGTRWAEQGRAFKFGSKFKGDQKTFRCRKNGSTKTVLWIMWPIVWHLGAGSIPRRRCTFRNRAQ